MSIIILLPKRPSKTMKSLTNTLLKPPPKLENHLILKKSNQEGDGKGKHHRANRKIWKDKRFPFLTFFFFGLLIRIGIGIAFGRTAPEGINESNKAVFENIENPEAMDKHQKRSGEEKAKSEKTSIADSGEIKTRTPKEDEAKNRNRQKDGQQPMDQYLLFPIIHPIKSKVANGGFPFVRIEIRQERGYARHDQKSDDGSTFDHHRETGARKIRQSRKEVRKDIGSENQRTCNKLSLLPR
jgi:hypothetical protein